MMSDNALMVRVKRGEIEHLGSLFERYHRRLFAFFYRLTHRRDVSEDLVQAVFERILKYRESFAEDKAFTSWMFGIARNLHLDYYKGQKKEYLTIDHIDFETLQYDSNAHHPDNELELDHWFVRKALNRLEPDKKQVLVLSRYEGLRYKEIADIMDCTESAVKVRVFRALQEMKETIIALRKQHSI
jgi:RNA polymerase sigma-70 factor (ECF subfamily)